MIKAKHFMESSESEDRVRAWVEPVGPAKHPISATKLTRKGFTLLEILMVLVIVTILYGMCVRGFASGKVGLEKMTQSYCHMIDQFSSRHFELLDNPESAAGGGQSAGARRPEATKAIGIKRPAGAVPSLPR